MSLSLRRIVLAFALSTAAAGEAALAACRVPGGRGCLPPGVLGTDEDSGVGLLQRGAKAADTKALANRERAGNTSGILQVNASNAGRKRKLPNGTAIFEQLSGCVHMERLQKEISRLTNSSEAAKLKEELQRLQEEFPSAEDVKKQFSDQWDQVQEAVDLEDIQSKLEEAKKAGSAEVKSLQKQFDDLKAKMPEFNLDTVKEKMSSTPLVAAPVLRGAPPPYDLGPAAYELGSGPSPYDLGSGPSAPPPPPVRPRYVPKPFVPRERKQVQKLQPAGPVLYTAPEAGYGGEPRYGSGVQVQDLSQVPGYPGKDYPLFPVVPETGFTCDKVPHRPGLYADPEAGCQAYHICGEDNRHGYSGADFLCTNGTLFNQYELTCDWWYNVDCSQAAQQYEVNLDPYKNPYLPTPEEVAAKAAQYGAPAPPQYSAPLPPLNYA